MEIKGIKVTPPQPEKQEEAVLSIVCDLCKSTEGKTPNLYSEVEWHVNSCYKFNKTTVLKHETGESYPECGKSHSTTFHICPECWNSKLLPWLLEQNATPTEKERDW